jgi:hypothetical protein
MLLSGDTVVLRAEAPLKPTAARYCHRGGHQYHKDDNHDDGNDCG